LSQVVSRRSAIWMALGLLISLGLSVYMRLTELHGVLALQDSVGPYLAAVRWDWRAHAPGYGFSLLIPYWFSLQVSSSLWDAAGAICGLHATIAPLAMLLALRVHPKAWGAALAIGGLAATDPGLIDTARSGAEGYFASTLLVGALLASRGWGWLLFGIAVANHPLAIASITDIDKPSHSDGERRVPHVFIKCSFIFPSTQPCPTIPGSLSVIPVRFNVTSKPCFLSWRMASIAISCPFIGLERPSRMN